MDVKQTLKEISQGLGGQKHANELHALLQLWLSNIKGYKNTIKELQATILDLKAKLDEEKGFYLGTWEEYDMYEEIHWVENQHVDGEDNYTGWVLQNIVRPGKYQELKLGKKVRIVTDE